MLVYKILRPVTEDYPQSQKKQTNSGRVFSGKAFALLSTENLLLVKTTVSEIHIRPIAEDMCLSAVTVIG